MTDIDLTYIAIAVIIAEVVIGYLYWRLVLDLRPNYSFRAFDYLFATIFFTLVVSRVAGILGSPDVFSTASFSDLFRIWDLHLNYFVIVFVPVIVFQFFVFNVERFDDWKPHMFKFLLFGELFALPIFISEVIRTQTNGLPQGYFGMHLLFLVWLLVSIFLLLFKLLKDNKLLTYTVLSTLLVIGWTAISLYFQELRDHRELLVTLTFEVLMLVVTVVPLMQRKSIPEVVRQLPIR